ncbi:MAG: T9SS type A sorting domain-containing protein [Candidatus Sabulitectum sp.]|nr:T9SS type A sorting domain-containing protein [Candidatus Sabulitectum sp.]
MTYIQKSSGNKEVLNAHFACLSGTGVTSDIQVCNSVLSTWPNPTTGAFTVSSHVPLGTTGTVDIFDIAGRSVGQFNAGLVQNMSIDDPGVYYIRLTTSSGEVSRSQIAVVK